MRSLRDMMTSTARCFGRSEMLTNTCAGRRDELQFTSELNCPPLPEPGRLDNRRTSASGKVRRTGMCIVTESE